VKAAGDVGASHDFKQRIIVTQAPATQSFADIGRQRHSLRHVSSSSRSVRSNFEYYRRDCAGTALVSDDN
jgi:hypothetical protein